MLTTNEQPKYIVGDIVEIVDLDHVYMQYSEWFELNEIDPAIARKHAYGEIADKGTVCTVVASAPHSSNGDYIYAVETISQRVFIMHPNGITLINSAEKTEESEVEPITTEPFVPTSISFDDLLKRGACYG